MLIADTMIIHLQNCECISSTKCKKSTPHASVIKSWLAHIAGALLETTLRPVPAYYLPLSASFSPIPNLHLPFYNGLARYCWHSFPLHKIHLQRGIFFRLGSCGVSRGKFLSLEGSQPQPSRTFRMFDCWFAVRLFSRVSLQSNLYDSRFARCLIRCMQVIVRRADDAKPVMEAATWDGRYVQRQI